MSADNWRICPQCEKNHYANRLRLESELKDAYGKIPLDDWKAQETEFNKTDKPFEDTNLREDYEFYITQNFLFSAAYKARCEVCGFTFQFKHEKEVDHK